MDEKQQVTQMWIFNKTNRVFILLFLNLFFIFGCNEPKTENNRRAVASFFDNRIFFRIIDSKGNNLISEKKISEKDLNVYYVKDIEEDPLVNVRKPEGRIINRDSIDYYEISADMPLATQLTKNNDIANATTILKIYANEYTITVEYILGIAGESYFGNSSIGIRRVWINGKLEYDALNKIGEREGISSPVITIVLSN